MKVLITGANGFLGSWLTRRLIDEGLEVCILRRPSSDISEILNLPARHLMGDVVDRSSVEEACRGVDTVFHLAGLVAYSKAKRPAMERVNVGGTENIVKACIAQKVRRLVHVSSVVAIGASFDGQVPLNEESAFNVGHLNLGYFETKRAGEKIVKDAVGRGELDAVILNPSTIYGPGDAKKGSRGTQLKTARGQFPFYTSGGVNVVAVEDVVEGISTAWKKGKTGERYILAGENLTIKDLLYEIAKVAGVRPPRIYLPRWALFKIGRIGDVMESRGKKFPINTENAWTSTLFHWFDNTKAKRDLGLTFGPSRIAIAKSVNWMKEQRLI